MKRFLPPVAAVFAFALAGAASAQTDATVTVHMRGLTANKGQVIVMLFDTAENYDASKPTQSNKTPATGPVADISFTGLAPGRYAIKAFYDYNGNDKYDPGIDFIGFSNRAEMVSGGQVPMFSATSFMVKAGANTQQINVARVRAE